MSALAHEHDEALVIVARAEAFRANASLDMLGQIVREAAGVRHDDGNATARAKIASRAACVSGRDAAEIAAFLGEIASVHFDDDASSRLAAVPHATSPGSTHSTRRTSATACAICRRSGAISRSTGRASGQTSCSTTRR